MKSITIKDFIPTQPSPTLNETSPFYLSLANDLYDVVSKSELGGELSVGLYKAIALTLTNYMEDIVADAGLWRSFINANRELYGYSVPFYPTTESYIDYELNPQDVRFLTWYVIAMLSDKNRLIHPNDERLHQLSLTLFKVLEANYDAAPVNEAYNISRGLEFKDPEDRDKILNLGNWLFLHSYLLTPSFASTLAEISMEINNGENDFMSELNKRLDEALMNEPIGPLALFTPEWVYLMLENKLPPLPSLQEIPEHKYYTAFTRYTNGKHIMFFDSYEKLNQFFIDALSWEKGEEHLAQVKGQHDYVLMVDEKKGMLMAINVARCIKAPGNHLYDKEYAEKNAFNLLVERGLSPGDLLKVVIKNNWLPDAHFPNSEDYNFVAKYADFIARCYLQLYYRGD